MNYNKIRKNIKVIWNLIGVLVFVLALFIVSVFKEDLYSSKAMMMVMIYLASDIAINIWLWWMSKKTDEAETTERSDNK